MKSKKSKEDKQKEEEKPKEENKKTTETTNIRTAPVVDEKPEIVKTYIVDSKLQGTVGKLGAFFGLTNKVKKSAAPAPNSAIKEETKEIIGESSVEQDFQNSKLKTATEESESHIKTDGPLLTIKWDNWQDEEEFKPKL